MADSRDAHAPRVRAIVLIIVVVSVLSFFVLLDVEARWVLNDLCPTTLKGDMGKPVPVECIAVKVALGGVATILLISFLVAVGLSLPDCTILEERYEAKDTGRPFICHV